MGPIETELQRQRQWAREEGLRVTAAGSRLDCTSDAIFDAGPTAETERELNAGAGSEMGNLTSFRSSAALVINVFEAWRSSPDPIARLLGGSGAHSHLEFEKRAPIPGLRGTPPHLDVVLSGEGPAIAIESKYLEMYEPCSNGFSDAYFDEARKIYWSGLERTRALAQQIRRDKTRNRPFRYLPAAQLVKHALGLRAAHSSDFRLVLLWYRIPGELANTIEEEFTRFQSMVGGEWDSVAVTYQQLFEGLERLHEPADGYLDYLRRRYFIGVRGG